jgi:hypothetical protein
MHVNWMEAQYFLLGLEHSLPSLVQWCTSDSRHNTLKWPTLLDINYTKSLSLLVKEFPIF